MNWKVGLALASCLVGLAACSGGGSGNPHNDEALPVATSSSVAPAPFGISGTITVVGNYSNRQNTIGSQCWTRGNVPISGLSLSSPFDYVKAGAQVVVTDAKGTVVGTGSVLPGVSVAAASGLADKSDCQFAFTVSSVPRGSNFYGIAIGGQAPVQVPAAQADHPVLTVGT